MNKKLLASAIAAALGFSLSSTSSMALVNMDSETGTAVFATELDIDTNGDLQTSASSTGGQLNAETKLGFGFSGGNSDIYILYELDNGATFSSALTKQNFASASTSDTVSLSQGGAAGDNFVVFNVTASSDISNTALVTLDLHDSVGTPLPNYAGITVVNKSPVNLRYRLFSTPSDVTAAVQGQTVTALKDKTAKLLEFAPFLGIDGQATPATAEVTADFKTFNDGISTTLANIGRVDFGADGTVLNNGVVAATPAEFLTSSTVLTLTGDFSGAASVTLDSVSTCNSTSGTYTGTIADTGDSATFPVGTGTGGVYYVCFTADTSNPMIAGYFDASYAGNSASEVAQIRRNGVELLAPFFTVHSTYIARFYLTNSSDKPVKFSVEVQKDDGVDGQGNPIPDCTLLAPYSDCASDTSGTCTIPANSNKLILANSLLATGQRCSATFRAAASEEAVHGHYTVRNKNTTDWDSYLMISIGAGNGH